MGEHVIGVLASGGGSNFAAIDTAIRDGRLPNTRIGIVISDKPDAGVMHRAAERSIPAYHLGTNEGRHDQGMADAVGHSAVIWRGTDRDCALCLRRSIGINREFEVRSKTTQVFYYIVVQA